MKYSQFACLLVYCRPGNSVGDSLSLSLSSFFLSLSHNFRPALLLARYLTLIDRYLLTSFVTLFVLALEIFFLDSFADYMDLSRVWTDKTAFMAMGIVWGIWQAIFAVKMVREAKTGGKLSEPKVAGWSSRRRGGGGGSKPSGYSPSKHQDVAVLRDSTSHTAGV